MRILLAGHFLDHKENILIFGNPGSGKTHMAGRNRGQRNRGQTL
ncbi:MAG: ATP-binding protein, partial [Candidatus Omnitrophica bacterium]|nr:ATP-binding protein [Candidatus Omnitrophota bacterium]